jgi:hypothetical protein
MQVLSLMNSEPIQRDDHSLVEVFVRFKDIKEDQLAWPNFSNEDCSCLPFNSARFGRVLSRSWATAKFSDSSKNIHQLWHRLSRLQTMTPIELLLGGP